MEFFAESRAAGEASDGAAAAAVSFAGTTLVMPAPSSHANVGQLAADLLVATLPGLARVGFLEDPAVLPCAGNDPFSPCPTGALTVAMEGAPPLAPTLKGMMVHQPGDGLLLRFSRLVVANALSVAVFQDGGSGVTVVQQRAPVRLGFAEDFADRFAAWAVAARFREVVILSGADAGKRLPEQMHGRGHFGHREQVRILSTAAPDASDARATERGWRALEQYAEAAAAAAIAASSAPILAGSADAAAERPSASSGGRGEHIAVTNDGDAERDDGFGPRPPPGVEPRLQIEGTMFWRMFHCCKARGLNVLALVLFCSEGDNVTDALAMADCVDRLLGLLPSEADGAVPGTTNIPGIRWRIPPSWASVYGPPPDTNLF
eukprot:SM000050S17055  [mRNA]  locus=s50:632392:634358:+ [translate_table: standard]